MRDAFDDLERELKRSVRATAAARSLHTRRRWRRTFAMATATALTISGVALAATQLVPDRDPEARGRKIAAQVVHDTASLPACSPASASDGRVLTDALPLPEIMDVLPSLAVPASRKDRERTLASLPDGVLQAPVLRRTVRTLKMQGGVSLAVFVKQGIGSGALQDPAACARARRDRATALTTDRPDSVKRWVSKRLEQMADATPGLQTLSVVAQIAGTSGMPGGGVLVRPGHPLKPGLALAGRIGSGMRVYAVIAAPGAARATVSSGRADATAVIRQAPVRQGFYAVVVPPRDGPALVREVDAEGRKLRELVLPR